MLWRAGATIAAALAALVAAGPAAAQTQQATAVSSNWAGYAVAGSDAVSSDGSAATSSSTTFTRVSGSWVQPKASCTTAAETYAAFWVGLGGFASDSQALEQVGTETDCNADGTATYSAWYELVPAPPVTVKLKVRPGDTVSASVQVTGTTVTLKLVNATRHTSFAKNVTVAEPDLSSAEWIAEAPSSCTSWGRCQTLPLTNFGTVTFRNAYATANGHTGPISDPAWSPVAVLLRATRFSRFFVVDESAAGATPAALSATGSSFSVAYEADAAVPPGQTPTPDPGDGGLGVFR